MKWLQTMLILLILAPHIHWLVQHLLIALHKDQKYLDQNFVLALNPHVGCHYSLNNATTYWMFIWCSYYNYTWFQALRKIFVGSREIPCHFILVTWVQEDLECIGTKKYEDGSMSYTIGQFCPTVLETRTPECYSFHLGLAPNKVVIKASVVPLQTVK